MQDPLRELYQRLNQPELGGSLERMQEVGCAWANEKALLISRVGVLSSLNYFNLYLELALKFGSGELPVNPSEAKLIHHCCLHVCNGSNTKLIEKLTLRARFSRHRDEIAAVSVLLANVPAMKRDSVQILHSLFLHLRDEEVHATPTAMKGRFVPHQTPAKWKSAKQTWPIG